MVRVKDEFDSALRRLIRTKQPAAVIPVGSIEQHGPHLPVSTDSDIVTEIARRLSQRSNFLLLPTLSYGLSFEHQPFFNLSIKKSTLQKILIDLCVSLAKNSIRTVFVINGHYGNQKAFLRLEDKVRRQTNGKAHVFVFSYWNFMKNHFDHAGLVETSLMLAISNQVRMNLVKKGFTAEGLTKKERLRLRKLATKSFPSVTKTGVWGDPRKATKRQGQKLLSEILENLQKKCQTCLTGKNPKLHQ